MVLNLTTGIEESQNLIVDGRFVGSRLIIPISEKNASGGQINTNNSDLIRGLALEKVIEQWGITEWQSLESLVMVESGWRWNAINPTSGACGLFQALPCEKMGCDLEDIECQLDWGLSYIVNRYQNPTNAYRFWLGQVPHWY